MSARTPLKRGAARLSFGDIHAHRAPTRDRAALAEAAERAEALAATLRAASLGDGPVPGDERYSLVEQAQALAVSVRSVVVR